MKNKFALALLLTGVVIGTVAIGQQPQRVAKVGGYGTNGGAYGPLNKAPFRVGLLVEVLVPAQEAGVLVELNAKEGQLIKADQPLGKVDDSQPIMQGRIAQAEHRAAEEKAKSTVDIRYAKKASEVAKKEWEKSVEVNKRAPNAVSEVEVQRQYLTYERGLLEIERAASDRVIASLTADAKKVEIDAALEAVRRRILSSPYDGMVVQVNVHKGEWVKPGDIVLHVVQLDKLKVEGEVEFARFAPSQIIDRPVTVEATVQDQKIQFEGRITFVKPLLDPLGKKYQVQAEVENRHDQTGQWLLLPNMPVDMTIHTK